MNAVENPESVAEHSFRVAALGLVFASEEAASSTTTLDVMKTTVMGLMHDVPESVCGDIVPTGAVTAAEKHRLEDEAMRTILEGDLGGAERGTRSLLASLWGEHEARATKESILVKDLDRFEMCVQAYEYEVADETKDLREFFDSVRGKLRTESVQRCFDELLELRERTVIMSRRRR